MSVLLTTRETRTVLRLVSGCLLATLFLATASAQTLSRGPYLQNCSSTAVTVRWRTSTATDSVVRYGTSPGSLTQSVTDSASVTEHELRLVGLSANTTYYYSAGSSTVTLASGPDYFVITAPTGAKPTRIWVLGDPGTGSTSQTAVRDAYYTFTGTRHTDLWLMLGDNAYNSGTDAEYTSKLFGIYPTMLRKSVLWTTYGNHDAASSDSGSQTGPYYAQHTLPKQGEAGGVASGTEAYYSFDYGNIHFICLDSTETSRSATGPMHLWLESDLANNTKDWTIAFWHHPPYSKGSHNSDTEIELVEMRTNFLPLLEQYGVDLVLCGHSHSYERSFFIDGHYGLSTNFSAANIVQGGGGQGAGAYTKTGTGPLAHSGAVYAVPGSSGQISGGTLNHPAMFVSLNVLGSMVLDLNGSRLDASFLDSTGVARDAFSIVKGPGNALPTVGITSPVSGATFTAPASITIDATAADTDGTVTKVDFYQGATFLGTDTTSPYSFTWNNVAAGTYNLTAVATDNAGGTGTSSAVSVTVNSPPNVAPTANITSPTNGATFTAPASITIDATASDTDGTVTKVDFYQGVTFLGTDTTSPYSFTWNNVAAGTYGLTAVATDNSGATGTSSVISVTVNTPANIAPTASITNPTNGATFTAPASITINATASDTDGNVTKVDFYDGATFLGTDTTSPYSFTWNNVAAGTYSLIAVATDNAGATGTSSAVSVTVNPGAGPTTIALQDGVNGYAGTRDTTLRSNSPTTNYGTTTTLQLDGNPEFAALIKWDLSSIPAGKTVTAVSVSFNVVDISSHTYEIYALKRDWTESGATWNQYAAGSSWQTAGANGANDRESTAYASISSNSTGVKTFVLNAAGIAKVQSWINNPTTNFGFAILDYSVANALEVSSRENATAANRPKITITYQ